VNFYLVINGNANHSSITVSKHGFLTWLGWRKKRKSSDKSFVYLGDVLQALQSVKEIGHFKNWNLFPAIWNYL